MCVLGAAEVAGDVHCAVVMVAADRNDDTRFLRIVRLGYGLMARLHLHLADSGCLVGGEFCLASVSHQKNSERIRAIFSLPFDAIARHQPPTSFIGRVVCDSKCRSFIDFHHFIFFLSHLMRCCSKVHLSRHFNTHATGGILHDQNA